MELSTFINRQSSSDDAVGSFKIDQSVGIFQYGDGRFPVTVNQEVWQVSRVWVEHVLVQTVWFGPLVVSSTVGGEAVVCPRPCPASQDHNPVLAVTVGKVPNLSRHSVCKV